MRVADLPAAAFRERLHAGLHLRMGPFVARLRSPFRDLAASLRFLYADHALDTDAAFADFHVDIVRPRGLRRFVRRQALFRLDGRAPFHPYPGTLSLPLLEWGLNWCVALRANHYLIVHAAVLERDGLAVLMPAKPGSGKSTLCAALAHRGWRLLSDEMALIRPADGALAPFPRPVGLKNESIDVIRGFAPAAALGPVWPDTKKGAVSHMRPPEDAVRRATETARPAWIVFPRWTPGATARFEEHDKPGAFLRVADNSMNYPVLGALGFEALAGVVEAADCYEFSYGDLAEAVEAFAALPPPAKGA